LQGIGVLYRPMESLSPDAGLPGDFLVPHEVETIPAEREHDPKRVTGGFLSFESFRR